MILDEDVELGHLPLEQLYNKMVVQRNNVFYVLNENYEAISLIAKANVSVRDNLESMTQARRYEGVNADGQQRENDLEDTMADALDKMEVIDAQISQANVVGGHV